MTVQNYTLFEPSAIIDRVMGNTAADRRAELDRRMEAQKAKMPLVFGHDPAKKLNPALVQVLIAGQAPAEETDQRLTNAVSGSGAEPAGDLIEILAEKLAMTRYRRSPNNRWAELDDDCKSSWREVAVAALEFVGIPAK